jgi:hypothetical protein
MSVAEIGDAETVGFWPQKSEYTIDSSAVDTLGDNAKTVKVLEA